MTRRAGVIAIFFIGLVTVSISRPIPERARRLLCLQIAVVAVGRILYFVFILAMSYSIMSIDSVIKIAIVVVSLADLVQLETELLFLKRRRCLLPVYGRSCPG